MIINGPNPDLPETIKTAERINQHHNESGPYPCCGHDFWEATKKLEYGDVIMCNRCHVYYAKIKHMPWIIKGKDYGTFKTEPKTYHQTDAFYAPIPTRVTD